MKSRPGIGDAALQGLMVSVEQRSGRAVAALSERLRLILEWYEGMVSERTGRLLYLYDPERQVAIEDGSPIRDIASVWDVEFLSRFLNSSDLLELTERSLIHFTGYLVGRDDALVLDPERLGEPSGIAHSAFLMLALLESEAAEREAVVVGLATGILHQQREDGSYRIFFDDDNDEGIELYPGETMLALMQAYSKNGDARLLRSVERGFRYYAERFPDGTVAPDLLAFFANWQAQYGAMLHASTRDEALRSNVRDYVFALHDRIVTSGFYVDVERHPSRQATVEVACALEGVNDAYAIAAREHDARRMRAYERAIRTGGAWLFRAQRLEACAVRERGGFGHSLSVRTQRIDVTGHVASAFIKSGQNGIEWP
jgi:hypothetical protein